MSPRAIVMLAAAASVAAGVVAFSCSSPPPNDRIGIVGPPELKTDFDPVANYLDARCGSLDCHGQPGRNLRIWGCFGMRLDPNDVPQCTTRTTDAEYLATYRSIVGLEPTVMTAVVVNGGAHPELLTMIRKARGVEAHKGGQLIQPGDVQDQCLTSWLAGQTDVATCLAALSFARSPFDASTE